jgi:hypothetical protein
VLPPDVPQRFLPLRGTRPGAPRSVPPAVPWCRGGALREREGGRGRTRIAASPDCRSRDVRPEKGRRAVASPIWRRP